MVKEWEKNIILCHVRESEYRWPRASMQFKITRQMVFISKCCQIKRVRRIFYQRFEDVGCRLGAIIIHHFITNKSQRLLFASGDWSALTYSQLFNGNKRHSHKRFLKFPAATRMSALCIRSSLKILSAGNSHA